MNANITTDQPIPTEDDLLRQGFSLEQIQRFTALKDRYPLNEFVTSWTALNRLEFLRWYYRAGRIAN